MDEYESVLCVKNEVFVYRIPPRSSNRGYRAAEWGLDNPDWTGRMRIVAKGKKVFIKLEDKSSMELFAECPVEEYPGPSVEQVLDSSRYFVIRIQDPTGRKAFIGIGFADRGDAFDLNVALQDHFKWAKRETEMEKTGASTFDPGPKLDLGFKEGETIKINIQTKKNQEGGRKPRSGGQVGSSSGILPPPPPSGAKISAPLPARNPTAGSSNTDLLLDFGNNSTSASKAPASDWTDFTSASSQQQQQQQQQQQASQSANTKNWVQF